MLSIPCQDIFLTSKGLQAYLEPIRHLRWSQKSSFAEVRSGFKYASVIINHAISGSANINFDNDDDDEDNESFLRNS